MQQICVHQLINPATLQNSLTSSSRFLLVSWLCIASCHLQTVTILLLLFQFGFLLFFSCLITVARTSKTMLNKSDKNGYPCLGLDLRGNAFTIDYDVSCGFVTYGIYYVEIVSLYAHLLESFFVVINGCWILSEVFSASVEMIMFLFFSLLMCCIILVCICLHPWDKSHLIMIYDPFNVLLDWVC